MWFYRTSAGEIGPVAGEEMVRLIEAGEISETTPVRRDGSDQWLEAWQTDRAGYLRTMAASDGASIDAGEVAGVWPRIGAYLIDYIGAIICSAVAGFIIGIINGIAFRGDESGMADILAVTVSFIVIFAYYGIPTASAKQSTFGMQALGLKMVRPNGQMIGVIRGGLRPFVASISMIVLLLGVIVALFNRERITFHDWVCGTRVVKA